MNNLVTLCLFTPPFMHVWVTQLIIIGVVSRWIREGSTSPSLQVIHILIPGDGHVSGRPCPTAGKQNGETHGMGNWIGIILVCGQLG